MWFCLYLHLRILNPDINQKKIIKYLLSYSKPKLKKIRIIIKIKIIVRHKMASSKLQEDITEDYLEEDKPITGQKYVCLSFISPENVLDDKKTFYFYNYLKSVNPEFNKTYTEFKEDFKYYQEDNQESIQEEFDNIVEYQTNVRGVKVRGVYDTLKEAEIRSEVLKKKENSKHNIYIAQAGCWCPWDPNPDEILDPIHSESELNTLMNEYNKNKEMNDEFYNSRKNDLIKRTEEENEKRKQQNESSSSSSLMENLQVKDAWSESKEL